MAKSLSELFPTVIWKVEFVIDELGYLIAEISKQSVGGRTHFLLELTVKYKKKEVN